MNSRAITTIGITFSIPPTTLNEVHVPCSVCTDHFEPLVDSSLPPLIYSDVVLRRRARHLFVGVCVVCGNVYVANEETPIN